MGHWALVSCTSVAPSQHALPIYNTWSVGLKTRIVKQLSRDSSLSNCLALSKQLMAEKCLQINQIIYVSALQRNTDIEKRNPQHHMTLHMIWPLNE